jgi:hypothetical protein
MKKMYFFSLLFLLTVSYSNLFSQPKRFNDLLERGIHNLNSETLEKLNNHKLNNLLDSEFEFNSKLYNKQFVTLGTADVVDSVIITNSDGSIEKHTYIYNGNGNKTLKLEEYWDGTNWVNSWRYTYTYDSNGNMTLFLSEDWDGTNWVYSDGSFYFIDTFGNFYYFYGGKIEIFYKTITNIEKENNNNFTYTLQQNYPNPFNPSTTIKYSLPKSGLVQLKVYDLLGREVVTLVNKEQTKGSYKINFNASYLTSGIYFYKLQSGNFSDTKKLILLR